LTARFRLTSGGPPEYITRLLRRRGAGLEPVPAHQSAAPADPIR